MDRGHILLLSIVLLVAGQRLWELRLSRKNEERLRAQGAVEEGRFLYPLLVLLHTTFLLALLTEAWWRGPRLGSLWGLWLGIFLAAQALRFWTISTLGPQWCTRLLVVPGMALNTEGPYRYIRHPNYLAVFLELLTLPLMFGALYTALGATLANTLLLAIRIHREESLLVRLTAYDAAMEGRRRFIPRRPTSPP